MITFTEKYENFDGRIITKEELLFDEDKTIWITAQWDCGSTYSSISKELALKLDLKPISKRTVNSTSNNMLSNIYDVGIVLRNSDIFVPVEAGEAVNIHQTGVDMLIGMDVISKGDFVISTYNGVTCFSFRYPSKGLIDFTE